MTHKTYCAISHGPRGKSRKSPASVFEPSPGFDLQCQLQFVCARTRARACATVVSRRHVTLMCNEALIQRAGKNTNG